MFFNRKLIIRNIIILVLFLFHFSAFSDEIWPIDSRKNFRIGFLRNDDQAPGINWYESLKKFLLQQPEIKSALKRNGYTGISALAADGHRDMLQRMDLNEFDMVFCSSVIFVKQHGDYRPILQLRGDIFDSRGKGNTLHKGVIIIGRNSPLFDEKKISREKISSLISSTPMAFVSSYNASAAI